MIPRIRGRTGQGEDGKFYNELSLWDFGGENQIGESFTFGPYETREEGLTALKEQAKTASDACEISAGGEPSGRYLDMKNGGILRSWVEQ